MTSYDQIRSLPKVSLHDHLDGGLRPETIIDLAPSGHELPADSAESLGRWFFESADSGSLVRYLETFDQTIAVMQTADNLRRVAYEFVEDMVADGVVHAETRWAPEQHVQQGLTLDEAILAVADGLDEGMAQARAQGRQIVARQVVTGMRQTQTSPEIASLAVKYRDRGVAGFDIAGPEDGFPPTLHSEAFSLLRSKNVPYTIHAGEAAGLSSIQQAVELGTLRIGHGVRIVEDITRDEAGNWHLGELASWVRDRRIPLELCPSSNLQTGAASTNIAEHPIGLLHDLRFRVTVNCDNRLMSDTTLSREFAKLCEVFDWTVEDLAWLTINAAKSVFAPFDERVRLIEQTILPAYRAAGARLDELTEPSDAPIR